MPFPTTGILDYFNRGDGPIGSAWSNLSTFANPWSIVSSTIQTTANGGQEGGSYWNGATYTESEIYATIVQLPDGATDSAGLEARITTPGGSRDCYHLDWAISGSMSIYKVTGNSYAELGTGISRTMTVGYKFGLSVSGGASTIIKAYTDEGSGWIERLSYTDTDTPFTGAGNIGIQYYVDAGITRIRLDDFGGGEITVPSASLVLPNISSRMKHLLVR